MGSFSEKKDQNDQVNKALMLFCPTSFCHFNGRPVDRHIGRHVGGQVSIRKKSAGVTLLEMLIVLTIMAILFTMASGGMSNLVKKLRQETAAQTLLSDFEFAKSKAISVGGYVVVCANDSLVTSPSHCNTSDWSKGWMVLAGPLIPPTYAN